MLGNLRLSFGSRHTAVWRHHRFRQPTFRRERSIPVLYAFPYGKAILLAAFPWLIDFFNYQLRPKRCPTCFGTGTLLCPKCHARGKLGDLLDDTELRICPDCDGRGKHACQHCNMTGIENYYLWHPEES